MNNNYNTEHYKQLEHLKLIEQQIQRMADNSFKIRGWSVTVISGGLLYWLKESNTSKNSLELIGLIFLATLLFWWLDSYYLTLERCYRKLYFDVQSGNKSTYTLNIKEYLGDINKLCIAVSSKPLKYIYGSLLCVEIILFINRFVVFKF